MLSVEAAHAAIADVVRPLPSVRVPLDAALGLRLAEDVTSDVDSPPHDKSVVDGYAVRAVDFARAARGEAAEPIEMAVLEEVTAGEVPRHELTTGHATRIMTGAPIPAGADAVVMVEQTEHHAEPGQPLGVVTFLDPRVTSGQNIKRRATSMSVGQLVLHFGATLRAAEIGLLAEVGRPGVTVIPRPRVAVLPTGDELVPPEMKPAAGQIRNSNGPMLLAAVRSAAADAIDLGIGRDQTEELRRLIEQGLEHDVLLLSGGVSAGTLDLVPGVLQALGVRKLFHKVSVKPGKPLWFGIREASGCLVFGLPGNPVSSLVGFELFVRPALARLAGGSWQPLASETGRLATEFEHRGNRPTFYPARLIEGVVSRVELLPWQGSGDLRTMTDADCLAQFAAGDAHYQVGDAIPFMRLLHQSPPAR